MILIWGIGINDQLDVARHLDGVDPISYPTYRPIDRILLYSGALWAFPKGMYFPDDGTANQNYSYRWICQLPFSDQLKIRIS